MGKIIQLSKKILNLYWLNHSDLVWAIFDSERNVGSRFWKKDRKWTKTEAFNQTSPLTNSFNFSRKSLVQKHTLILYLHTGVRCYRKSIQWSYKQGLHAKITARQCTLDIKVQLNSQNLKSVQIYFWDVFLYCLYWISGCRHYLRWVFGDIIYSLSLSLPIFSQNEWWRLAMWF